MHPDLDLVESDDQITHEISLDDDSLDRQDALDVFHYDPNYEESEKLWASIRKEILGGEASDSSESGSSEEDDSEDDSEGEHQQIISKLVTTDIADMSQADLINLRYFF